MLPNPETSNREASSNRCCGPGKMPRGQRSVGPPAHVRRAAGAVKPASAQKAEIEKKPAQRRQPETECIQPRKGHVPRPDHQRHKIVRKPKQDRHGDEENHGGAMHGEQAVEDLRRDKDVVRMHQLDPHNDGFDSGDHQKRQSVDDVENTEPLVIDRGYPLMQAVDPRPAPSICAP